jgi:2,5-diamino-6-(ribosylamino)-4(3H)-pyrimidinone 5'-phosphate reductase
MKPHVTCHILSTIDGRIVSPALNNASKLFETTAAQLKADAWLVGRTTFQEFCSQKPLRRRRGRFTVPKGDFVAPYDTKTFAVGIDPEGKCRWESNRIDTEHAIEVLTEAVSAEYLDHLRSMQVSYIFGGRRELDLKRVLAKLADLFPIRKIRIDGGGHVIGSFLKAGLVDEFSHVIAPGIDGRPSALSMIDAGKEGAATQLRLRSVKRLPRGALWCRYAVKQA